MHDHPIYPWLLPTWNTLVTSSKAQALLLEGHEGLGCADLAERLAFWHLCLNPSSQGACGHCQSCLLDARAGVHPDAVWLLPAETGKQIGIASIRAIQSFTYTKPQIAPHKVVVMGPIENLNVNAANALLKSLEEPIESLFFLLWSHQPGQVLATVKSRCQRFPHSRPDFDGCLQWLQTELAESNRSHSQQSLIQALTFAQGWPLLAKNCVQAGLIEQFESCLKDLRSLSQDNADWLTVADRWGQSALPDLDLKLGFVSTCLQKLVLGEQATEQCPFLRRGSISTLEPIVHLDRRINQLRMALQRGQNYLNLKMQVTALLVDWRRLVINTEIGA